MDPQLFLPDFSDYSSDHESAEPPEPVHYELTVPLLVALTTASGGRFPRDDERRDFPAETWLPGHGISRQLSTNDRFRRVLDALASLCVSRARKQVFAIGVQLTTSTLTLTIADNQPVTQTTVDYLDSVWGTLTELSDLYAGPRDRTKYHPSGIEWSKYSGVSPRIPRSQKATELTLDLATKIYGFTRDKNLQRWAKRWDPPQGNGLLDFSRRFRAKKGTGLDGKEGQFEMMVTKLNIALACLRHGKNANWADVLGYMNDATDIADELLADKYWCEILAIEIFAKSPADAGTAPVTQQQSTESSAPDAAPETKPEHFPLRRHIEKLTSNHRYFRALIAFAHSPRLRSAFTRKRFVKHVSLEDITPAGEIELPTTANSWANLLDDLCEGYQFHIQTEQAQPIIQYLTDHHHTDGVPHRVHSECALVAHYDKQRTSNKDYTPAFAYLGVSKLSCKPCHLWLSAYNERAGVPKFYTRGSHGSWYFPWSPPTIAGWNPRLENAMEKACLAYLRVRGVLRSNSDSTVASGETSWEDDANERAQREERTRRAEIMMRNGI